VSSSEGVARREGLTNWHLKIHPDDIEANSSRSEDGLRSVGYDDDATTQSDEHRFEDLVGDGVATCDKAVDRIGSGHDEGEGRRRGSERYR
jgi:hypothetical protein